MLLVVTVVSSAELVVAAAGEEDEQDEQDAAIPRRACRTRQEISSSVPVNERKLPCRRGPTPGSRRPPRLAWPGATSCRQGWSPRLHACPRDGAACGGGRWWRRVSLDLCHRGSKRQVWRNMAGGGCGSRSKGRINGGFGVGGRGPEEAEHGTTWRRRVLTGRKEGEEEGDDTHGGDGVRNEPGSGGRGKLLEN